MANKACSCCLRRACGAGFILQAQTTGKGPIGALSEHLGNPFGSNIVRNIGKCVTPDVADVQVSARAVGRGGAGENGRHATSEDSEEP